MGILSGPETERQSAATDGRLISRFARKKPSDLISPSLLLLLFLVHFLMSSFARREGEEEHGGIRSLLHRGGAEERVKGRERIESLQFREEEKDFSVETFFREPETKWKRKREEGGGGEEFECPRGKRREERRRRRCFPRERRREEKPTSQPPSSLLSRGWGGEGEEAKFNLAEGGEKEERGGCTLYRERGDAIDLRGRYFA